MAVTRRERLREALTTDIKDCATRQLVEGGPAVVTLRGIARELGVSPAALYGYFENFDALLTALITDGYDELADAVSEAVGTSDDGSPVARMIRGVHAFRLWAITNPERFRLLYFAPIPGYHAPDDGPVLTASLRVFVPMLALLVDAWESGAMPPAPPGPPIDVSKFHERFGLPITSDQLRLASECWAEFHGLVALEINGHIHADWVDPAALYEANVASMTARMGLS